VIDVSDWRERKEAALRAHRSQHLSIDRLFFSQKNLDAVLGLEVWRQGWGPRLHTRPSHDLLEGIA
jgi:LmbE family N-acetylglucosaminyl deacetylase